MRTRLALIATVALLLGLLAILNAASYVYKNEPAADSEFNPNRSSYHEGNTGTRGLFEFLQGSDYRVVRWRKSLVSLLDGGASRPQVLLIIGRTRIPFDEKEHVSLARWVGEGGRLVIVDRELAPELLRMLAGWHLFARMLAEPSFTLGEEKPEAVTQGVTQLSPAQPTLLTREVKAIMPSRYAARLTLSVIDAGEDDEEETDGELSSPTPPPAAHTGDEEEAEEEAPLSTAPVVHFSDEQGALLVDHAYGGGRIMLLSDPFLLANNGIARADNLQLALNLIGGREPGLVAFDEYHHGHGAARETLFTYFAGTPVPVLAAQLVLLVLVFAWARGRRFARALPAPHEDRRSKLEFITSMAELQMRARAFDLALENIYARTRRVLARTSGTEASASRERIAVRVADQSGRISKQELEKIMRACDEAIAGAPTDGKKALALAAELRRVERLLGTQTRRREAKQGVWKSER